MKHLKLFEKNWTTSSIRNTIKEHNDFLLSIKPFVLSVYYELAKDENYQPDYGDKPDDSLHSDELTLSQVAEFKGGFEFTLSEYDYNGSLRHVYFISVSDEELEKGLIELDTKKYNL